MNEPTVSVTLKRTVKLEDYQSASVELSLCGLTTESEIEPLLEKGALMYKAMVPEMARRVAEVKKTHWESKGLA